MGMGDGHPQRRAWDFLSRLSDWGVEATPGIEPGYTVLQTPTDHFPKPLTLTDFPTGAKKVPGNTAQNVAVNGNRVHPRERHYLLVTLTNH